jgi:hypothetical protein
MPKAWVTVTAFNAEGYSKTITTLSEQQIHMNDMRCREPQSGELIGKVGIVIDPKDFPEMDRFVVSVELVKSN